MDKIRKAYFQKLAGKNRKKVMISLCVIAALCMVLFFIGMNMQNMGLAIVIISAAIPVVYICYAFFILNLIKRTKIDSYAFHLKKRDNELHHETTQKRKTRKERRPTDGSKTANSLSDEQQLTETPR